MIKAAVCAAIFAIFLYGGWQAERSIEASHYTGPVTKPLNDVRIVHTYELESEAVFRPRQYVKIVRISQDDPKGPHHVDR